MSEKPPESEPKEDRISQLEAKLDEQGKKIRAMSGQVGLIRKEVGMGRPGQALKSSGAELLSPEQAPKEALKEATSPEHSHEEAHPIFDYHRSCPGCGGTNINFKEPTIRCKNCAAPISTKEPTEENVKQVIEKTKTCYNCGMGEKFLKDPIANKDDELRITTRTPKGVIW